MNSESSHPSEQEIRSHQRAFLDQVKARQEPTTYTVEGIDIKVNPGVFPPATDTKLLAANIKTRSGERTLDLTTGAGTFSIIAGRQGASGIAVDINPAAVENAKQNFAEHKVQMEAIQSDLFENIPPEQFDQIYANGPFFEGEITEPLDHATYGFRNFTEKLLSEVGSKLKMDGKLLIVIHTSADLKFFEEQAKANNLNVSLSDVKQSDDGQRSYNLYEVRVLT